MTMRAVAGGSSSSGITVGTTTVTSGADKQVLFQDGTTVGENAALLFDKATKRLMIDGSANTPCYVFGVGAASATVPSFRSSSTNNTIEAVSSDATQWTNFGCGTALLQGAIKFQGSSAIQNDATGYVGLYNSGITAYGGAVGNQFRLVPTGGGTPDVALQYSAAGVAQISDTAGANRDLKVRSLISSGGVVTLSSFTVATLPSAATSGAGATAFVTDASTTLVLGLGTTVVGGGANKTPVYSDGTNWIIG